MDTVNIEVIVKDNRIGPVNQYYQKIGNYLSSKSIRPGCIISKLDEDVFLQENIEHIIIGETTNEKGIINLDQHKINWFFYTLDKNGMQSECIDKEDGEVNVGNLCQLPSADFYNLWESLIYDDRIKENLLKFVSSTLLFADKGVDYNIINCNRVVLLHGPPGTGKTALCKALAQKLSIRLNQRFQSTFLFEINSHSLFSKFFSESGKLVTTLFSKVKEYLEDSKSLVCILIDEIESITHARDKCLAGVEPSDSIRVVNAVLTQIDQIKKYPNVIILTTSNMTGAIDIAFVDRADIKQYIGVPNVYAIYQIYYSCLEELMKVGIIRPRAYITAKYQGETNEAFELSYRLFNVCKMSEGLSGRALRKIPFVAHSLFGSQDLMTFDEFLEALSLAVTYWKEQHKQFKS